jgi:MbtH protein
VVLARTQPNEEATAMSEDTTVYKVVRNQEEQYSIWPVGRELPLGWSDAGFEGSKEACLRHIEEIWTDMRPRTRRADAGGTDTTGGGP